jgi:hypothetical protein
VHTRDRVKKTNEEQKYTKQWFKRSWKLQRETQRAV